MQASFQAPSIDVRIDGQRAIVVNTVEFLYIDKWSEMSTWGGMSPPVEGDLVNIPKGQNILLDVSTPVLNTLIIEGRLVVQRDKDLTL